MNTIEALRDAAAKSAVLRQYAVAHDHWAEQEQLETQRGHRIEAEGCHGFALVALKAYLAELKRDEP